MVDKKSLGDRMDLEEYWDFDKKRRLKQDQAELGPAAQY